MQQDRDFLLKARWSSVEPQKSPKSIPRSHPIFHHLPSSSIIFHHLPSSSIIFHHLPSSSIIFHHLPSSSIIFHHLPSSSIIFHHLPSSSIIFHPILPHIFPASGLLYTLLLFRWWPRGEMLCISSPRTCATRRLCWLRWSSCWANSWVIIRWWELRCLKRFRNHGRKAHCFVKVTWTSCLKQIWTAFLNWSRYCWTMLNHNPHVPELVEGNFFRKRFHLEVRSNGFPADLSLNTNSKASADSQIRLPLITDPTYGFFSNIFQHFPRFGGFLKSRYPQIIIPLWNMGFSYGKSTIIFKGYLHFPMEAPPFSLLVGGLVAIFGIFPYIGLLIIPIDSYFSEGWLKGWLNHQPAWHFPSRCGDALELLPEDSVLLEDRTVIHAAVAQGSADIPKVQKSMGGNRKPWGNYGDSPEIPTKIAKYIYIYIQLFFMWSLVGWA